MLLCLLAFTACDNNRNKRPEREALRFRTTDDAELFFRNLRRTEYNHQNLKEARLDIFRHEGRSLEADYPVMIPALVINWRYDEAYILLESNELVGEARPLIIEWQDSLTNTSGRYILEGNDKMDQLMFATALYEGMQDRQSFFLVRDSGKVPFLTDPADRKVFRATMLDYYRLTGTVE